MIDAVIDLGVSLSQNWTRDPFKISNVCGMHVAAEKAYVSNL